VNVEVKFITRFGRYKLIATEIKLTNLV